VTGRSPYRESTRLEGVRLNANPLGLSCLEVWLRQMRAEAISRLSVVGSNYEPIQWM
jgi:hypothetical protein